MNIPGIRLEREGMQWLRFIDSVCFIVVIFVYDYASINSCSGFAIGPEEQDLPGKSTRGFVGGISSLRCFPKGYDPHNVLFDFRTTNDPSRIMQQNSRVTEQRSLGATACKLTETAADSHEEIQNTAGFHLASLFSAQKFR
jgi:hypothetical protein